MFAQMKQNVNKENERTQMLISLVEEVMQE